MSEVCIFMYTYIHNHTRISEASDSSQFLVVPGAHLAHVDVALDERALGVVVELRVALVARERHVLGERLDAQHCRGGHWRVLEIE